VSSAFCFFAGTRQNTVFAVSQGENSRKQQGSRQKKNMFAVSFSAPGKELICRVPTFNYKIF
jgi:hypothetical protein